MYVNFSSHERRFDSTVRHFAYLAVITIFVVRSASAFDGQQNAALDAKAIQGQWKCTEVIEEGKNYQAPEIVMDFEDDKITMLLEGKKQHTGTFTLGPSAIPATIDMKLKGVSLANADQDIIGIYKIEKDKLTICAGHGNSKRPSTFAYSKKSPTFTFILERSAVQKPKARNLGTDEHKSDELGHKPLLVQMAEDHGYRLAEGEDIKRIPLPFDIARTKYFYEAYSDQAATLKGPPVTIVFGWSDRDGGLKRWNMNFEERQTLGGLLDALTTIKGQRLEGPEDVLRRPIHGDWIVRVGTRDFHLIKQLEEILRHDFAFPIRLQFKEAERPVFVVTGEYKFKPLEENVARLLPDHKTQEDSINIFGKGPVPDSGVGDGRGRFSEMLGWLGKWIEMPVISDLKNPPTNDFAWHFHARSPATKETLAEDHDPKLVMANFAVQTGLTVTEEVRPGRVLFVTREEPTE